MVTATSTDYLVVKTRVVKTRDMHFRHHEYLPTMFFRQSILDWIKNMESRMSVNKGNERVLQKIYAQTRDNSWALNAYVDPDHGI